jgi:hypothetical protein
MENYDMLKKLIKLVIFMVFFVYILFAGETLNDSLNQINNPNSGTVTDQNRDIFLVFIGGVFGLIFGFLGEIIRTKIKNHQRKKSGEHLLKSILDEIDQGIKRCDYLIRMKDENKISFSRIYISLWKSMQVELSHYIYEFLKEPKVLRIIHSTYYTFDLINFNMERSAFAIGAAFANDHRKKLKENLDELNIILSQKKINKRP